jgi:hypothetical protein
MAKRFAASTIALATIFIFSTYARSQVRQPGAVYDFDPPGEKPGPAPRRDISANWEPAGGVGADNANGAQQMPSDGKPEHELPSRPRAGSVSSE